MPHLLVSTHQRVVIVHVRTVLDSLVQFTRPVQPVKGAHLVLLNLTVFLIFHQKVPVKNSSTLDLSVTERLYMLI